MRGVAAFAALLAANLLALPAQARMHAGPGQLSAGHRLQGMIAPLDGGGSFSTPAAAYSLRRLKSTYAGPAIKLRRASDNATQDINFLGFTGFTGAPIDTAAAAAFCASTTCFYATWYDQSGNARDMVQATLASQPAYVANCVVGKPCLQDTAAVQTLSSASVTWASVVTTISVVANRAVGLGQCRFTSKYLNTLEGLGTAANTWITSDNTSNSFSFPVTDNAWHSAIVVLNGASTLYRVDATEGAGSNVAGASTAGAVSLYGVASTTCIETEVIIWDGYALTAGERANLAANQRAHWGF